MIQYSRTLYPEIEPYHTFRLKVSNVHELYVEECGNPQGKPVIFLHGGPGSGINPGHRRFFHPEKYRVILFDQRGCGQSTPFASIHENSTDEIVEDIEKIRNHLGISTWQVFGGSWGSFLGLTYAQNHPSCVTELVLRGIFTATPWETDWIYKHGASEIFYKDWLEFIQWIPENERADLVKAYHQRLNHSNQNVCVEAAKRWNHWEGSILSLYRSPKLDTPDENSLPRARLECFYALNKYFNDHERFFKNIERIQNIPGVIVQGQYDMVCPARSAFELKRVWPISDLRIVPDAGHSSSEPGIVHELVTATDFFSR